MAGVLKEAQCQCLSIQGLIFPGELKVNTILCQEALVLPLPRFGDIKKHGFLCSLQVNVKMIDNAFL